MLNIMGLAWATVVATATGQVAIFYNHVQTTFYIE